MKTLLFAIALFCSLYCCYAVSSIDCNVNEQRLYNYKSKIHTFGGTQGKKDNKDSTKGERTEIKADVYFTCVKQWLKREQNVTASRPTRYYLMHMAIKNVDMQFQLDDPSKITMKKVKGQKKEDLDKYFKQFTAFTMSSNGKIHNVLYDKKEEQWVTAMKKSIIGQMQLKFGENEKRTEKGGIGTLKARYNATRLDGGLKLIHKQFTDKDIKSKNIAKRKQMRLNSSTNTFVDKNGNIRATVRHEKVVLGTHHLRKHQAFLDERNIPFAESNNFATGSNMFMNSDEVTGLEFVKTVPFRKPTKTYVRGKKDEEMVDSHPELLLHDDLVQSDLSMDEDMMNEMGRTIRKNMLAGQYNVASMTEELYKNPEDAVLTSKLSEFAYLDDSNLDVVLAKFNHVYETVSKDHDFLKVAQAIIAAGQSPKAQRMLLTTFKTKPLTHHALVKTITIEKPIEELADVMSFYAQGASSDSNDVVNMNAFLLLADMAPRLPAAKSKVIVDNIASMMANNSTSMKNFLFYLHAIGNAGNAVPFEYISRLLTMKRIPEKVKLIAAETLRKRVNKKDDAKINALIHKLVDSKTVSLKVKLALIKSQIERETLLGKGSSIHNFKQHMLKPKTPKVLKSAMKEYFVTHGTDEAGEILADIKKNWAMTGDRSEEEEHESTPIEEMSDAEFLKKVGKAFKKVGKKISTGVKKVGKKISTGAKKVGKKIATGVKKVGKKIATGAKKVGKKIAAGAKKVGKKIATGVKKVGTAIKKGVQAIGKGVKAAANKVKKVVSEAKKVFGAAKFEGNKICVPASAKPNDNICLYDKTMINYITRFGDMSNHQYAAHFEFEKLIGSQKIHLYIGALGYAGTNFKCSAPADQFEFVAAAKFDARANVFSKTFNILTASAHSSLKGVYDDNVFVRILGTTLVDTRILNEKQVEKLCREKTKPLANKDFNNLPGGDFTIMIGPIPLTFGFRLTANARLDVVAGYCINDLSAKAGLRPSVSVGISGYAAIGIVIAKAGIEVEVSLNYGVFPNMNLRGMSCKICANLDNSLKPMNVRIRAFAEINLWIIKGKTGFTIYQWSAPAENKPIFEKCFDLPRLFGHKALSTSANNM